MMNTSFNSSTLSRCQTPNSTLGGSGGGSRAAPSPKCFGRNTHMLKEEYERERVRWQQKLEEAEQKLTEASINNSELFQIKAELNRKIIDFEKNQRPMIEQNRRLNDRIRALNNELKELEKKLAFAQDDFLSLRDSYDRLIKENSLLKEQRAFPEKLEELGRYRNQMEAPSRHADMVERLKTEIKGLQEAKRSLEVELANTQHNNELLEFQLTELTEGLQHAKNGGFSDKQCSTDVQLSTADAFQPADFELRKRVNVSIEDAALACESLMKVLRTNSALLRREDFDAIRKSIEISDALQNQLAFLETELNMTNCELNRVRRQSEEEIGELRRQSEESTTKKQQKRKELQAEIDQLKKEKKEESKKSVKQLQELQNSLEQRSKEIIEKTDQIRHLNGEIRVMSTKIESQNAKISSDSTTICELREQFEELAADLARAKADIDAAKQRAGDENSKMSKNIENLEKSRRDSLEEAQSLRAECARLGAENAALETRATEAERSAGALNAKFAAEQRELESRFRDSLDRSLEEADADQAKVEAEKRALERELCDARAQIHTLKEQIRPIGTQLERRYEESRFRLSEALKKIYELEKQRDENGGVPGTVAGGGGELSQLRLRYAQSEAYNRELQDQFNAQLELMNVLKKELIMLKTKKTTQSTDSIGWTSNSSEGSNSMDDEQYHSEGCDTTSATVPLTTIITAATVTTKP